MSLGERVKAEREARGWTRAELAQRSGLTAPYISMLEAGKRPNPNVVTLRQLAAALDLSVAELEGETDAAAGPFPAATLRSWGISEADLAQYSAAWPYWSHADRVKFLGNLRLITNVRASVQAMTNEVQAKVRALENKANQDDDPDDAAPALAPQVAM